MFLNYQHVLFQDFTSLFFNLFLFIDYSNSNQIKTSFYELSSNETCIIHA